jgi:mono/diheme cytochrome c family protein
MVTLQAISPQFREAVRFQHLRPAGIFARVDRASDTADLDISKGVAMRGVLKLFAAALMAVGVGGVIGAPAPARAQDAPPGNAADGKRLYLAVGCFTCHGRSGQGGAMNGPVPRLAKTAMPFDGFKGQLRNPVNDMPAYSEAVMSDRQVADIYAFVQSLPGPLTAKDMAIFKD